MSKPLIIVESPTKVKTIQKYIGENYNVAATAGHIKDLPKKGLAIDIEDGFKPQYEIVQGKQKTIKSLKHAADGSIDIYLAPDPDREGEAIAWHTAEVLKSKGRKFYRVLFHELTKQGIIDAIESPEELNLNKYEAQQTRRILDRLVGYQISPLLWNKVKMGLSAGRVQSVAVRIICERERAIQAFNPEEYWTITATVEGNSSPPFIAKLTKKNNKKLNIPDKNSALAILNDLKDKPLIVDNIVKKTTKKNPLPPFTTSKLQQEAIRRLRFTAKKTMIVAQQLYEGIELGQGEVVGLITYMRTDSTRISKEAALEAQKFITEKFGEKYSMPEPRFFKNQKKVQDAHEAIRPTSVYNTPENAAPYLSYEQLALYKLIWQRFIASQMKEALIDKVSISIKAGNYLFTASGSTILFEGFMTLYMVSEDEAESENKDDIKLPELSEKMVLKLKEYEEKQHFTMPPPRFSEASLVKELEENGIGRPSTYATILSTIREKGYVELLKTYFKPSELGFIVNDLLVENFPDVLNVSFTAQMEDELDHIETKDIKVLEVLTRFYDTFKNRLDTASKNMQSVKGVGLSTGFICPGCGKDLRLKVGKNGPFIACSGYPDCSYTRNYQRDEKGNIQTIEPAEEKLTDKICEKCGKPMVIKSGKFGTFLACSGYPECKNTQSVISDFNGKAIGVICPLKDCDGEIVPKRSKRGKTFYGCNKYPDCQFAMWEKPLPIKCPDCEASFLIEKSTKKEGVFASCITKGCGFKKTLTD